MAFLTNACILGPVASGKSREEPFKSAKSAGRGSATIASATKVIHTPSPSPSGMMKPIQFGFQSSASASGAPKLIQPKPNNAGSGLSGAAGQGSLVSPKSLSPLSPLSPVFTPKSESQLSPSQSPSQLPSPLSGSFASLSIAPSPSPVSDSSDSSSSSVSALSDGSPDHSPSPLVHTPSPLSGSPLSVSASPSLGGAGLAQSLGLEGHGLEPVEELSPKAKLHERTKLAQGALKLCAQSLASLEKSGYQEPTSFVGALSMAGLALCDYRKETLLQVDGLPKTAAEHAQESCDDLFLATKELEFIADAIYNQRYDLLLPFVENFIVMNHLAREQAMSHATLCNGKQLEKDHSLVTLAKTSGIKFTDSELRQLEADDQSLKWVRYAGEYEDRFRRRKERPPEVLQCLFTAANASRQGDKVAIRPEEIHKLVDVVFGRYINTLKIVLGPDCERHQLYVSLIKTAKSLHQFLYKTSIKNPTICHARCPTKTSTECTELQSISREVDAACSKAHFVRDIAGQNPTERLRTMQYALLSLQKGFELLSSASHLDPRNYYSLLRNVLKLEKAVEALYQAHAIIEDHGHQDKHKLKDYHYLLRQQIALSPKEQRDLEDLNIGIKHHYIHRGQDSICRVARDALKHSQLATVGELPPVPGATTPAADLQRLGITPIMNRLGAAIKLLQKQTTKALSRMALYEEQLTPHGTHRQETKSR